MRSVEEILLKYEHADMDERIWLFLTYRDLRSDFMEIELNPAPSHRGAKPRLYNLIVRRKTTNKERTA